MKKIAAAVRRAASAVRSWAASRACRLPCAPPAHPSVEKVRRPAYEVEKLILRPRDALDISRVLIRSH
eukprot:7116116-Prymnesium_polylepis.2